MKLLPLALAALTPLVVAADPLPGHSANGEAFNEGPRQAAVLMDGIGNAHLPITSRTELAQRFFDQGLGQLHGFWYFEAERSFRQAASIDPGCAMAYWGMAMANVNNPKRASEFAKKSLDLKASASHHEQLWIDAFGTYFTDPKKDEKERRAALVRALEEIIFEFKDDLEAKAFLVYQIWDNKTHGMPIESRAAVEALAQQVLAVNPSHPGIHHYLIHLWNTPGSDKHALTSAARGGQAAPGIAHLWHMPGHTFSNLHRYADAAWQQEASARVDHAYLIASHTMPDQIHNFAHNNEWLAKNLGYIGRVHDSVDLSRNMIELPRLGSKSSPSYNLGRSRLLETLLEFELWDELLEAGDSMYLAAFDDIADEIRRHRALGIAGFSSKNAERGEKELAAITKIQEKLRADRIAAADQAEATAKAAKKSEEEISKAMTAALRGFAYRFDLADNALAELRTHRALLAGNLPEAKTQVGIAKDIPSIRLSRIRFALGEFDAALKLAREASTPDEGQAAPLANLADLAWRAGKKDEAFSAFDRLRKISAQIDLDVPVFARATAVAKEKGLPQDWRPNYETRDDTGVRPDLPSLGPFRWHPSAAPAWALSDADGKTHSIADYRGQPVIVLFYLGSGCAKCIEQLNTFAPLVNEFAAAGIKIVAISTESPGGLQQTFAKSSDGKGFPFPIVADPSLQVFKAYRAFDDFEKIPLHGAFLIDGEGRIRWQDISYQAFRDAKWLLGESKRLLQVPTARLSITAN